VKEYERQPGAGGHRKRFNGKEDDVASGLRYYGFRSYDPVTLRWVSRDPLYHFAPEAGGSEVQRMNLYGFSLNNPVNLLDPNGLDPDDDEPKPSADGKLRGGELIFPDQSVQYEENGQRIMEFWFSDPRDPGPGADAKEVDGFGDSRGGVPSGKGGKGGKAGNGRSQEAPPKWKRWLGKGLHYLNTAILVASIAMPVAGALRYGIARVALAASERWAARAAARAGLRTIDDAVLGSAVRGGSINAAGGASSFGARSLGAAEVRILQTGGNRITSRTAKALNELGADPSFPRA
jgi:RHS repeat-associated protein